jgi:hypothetical protein
LRGGSVAGLIHPVFPATAGTQIHPERLVGFTWAPAFAGEAERGAGSLIAVIADGR